MIYRTPIQTGRNGRPEGFVYRDHPDDGYVLKVFEHVDGWVVLDTLRGGLRGLKLELGSYADAVLYAEIVLEAATAVDRQGKLTFDRAAVERAARQRGVRRRV